MSILSYATTEGAYSWSLGACEVLTKGSGDTVKTAANQGNGRESANDIAIVGMAVNVPGAASLDAFWANLRDGVESIVPLSHEALIAAGEDPSRLLDPNYVAAAALLDGFDTFDAEFFGFSPKEAAILDPQHRKFLEVAWEALENAGHTPDPATAPVGVYAGCGMGSYFYFNICSNPDLVDETGMFLLRHTGNDKDFLSTRVSHVFDLKGPSINMQTACSTSLVAIHYAVRALRDGDIGMAIAGGVTIDLPQGRGYVFKENEILSPDGHCHAFDSRAQGTVFGSGAGAVVLRRLSDAIADGDHIWAVIKGSAVNNDGAAKAGYLAPSVDGQSAAITLALADAGVAAETIQYVECHGTGTALGDPIEVAALSDAYRKSTDATGFCRIGSVKTNIGHLDTAAGVAGLVKTVLAMKYGVLPPSLGFETPNPAIDFAASPFRVNDRLSDWAAAPVRRAAVNALGVGGTNAHVVIAEAPARAISDASDFPFQILCVSGRSKAALEANAAAIAAHLAAHPEQPLADVAWTLRKGRRAFDKRRVVVAETHAAAAAMLTSDDPRQVFTHDVVGAAPEVVFMFPGGGAQYANMGRDLYETEPVFADWMDRGLEHLQRKLDYDIRAIWLPEPETEAAANLRLQKPSVQLPLIMIVEYALAQLWLSWGVKPAALVGHSMGENTAACLAGVMGFEDCIDLVLLRGQLFDTVPAGGMLSVSLSLTDLTMYLTPDLDIASVNAPMLTAVSGPQSALDNLQARLAGLDIQCQRIAIDIAAHSRMLDSILERFGAFLRSISLSAPSIPFMSNRTGQPITDAQATDPDYWVAQLRNTVNFADCMATLAKDSQRVYLEVGPGKALSSLAGMNAPIRPNQVLASLRHPDQDIADDAYFLGVIGRLWATGVDADWSQIWGAARRNRVVLPTYAFQRSRYFIAPGQAAVQAEPPLIRTDDITDWGWRPHWKPALAAHDLDLSEGIADAPQQNWLIFQDDMGLGADIAAQLLAAGHTVTTVRAGDTFAALPGHVYTIAPEAGTEGYDAILADLADKGRLPHRIAHLWLVTGAETFRPGSNFFERNLEYGFHSLFHLAQSIGNHGLAGPIHMTIVTNGAAQVRGEALPYPEKALVSGPAGVISQEFPGITCATLDIEVAKGRIDPALVDRVLEDLLADPATLSAAFRGDKRLELAHRAARLSADAAPLTRDGGTYLLTGGFGGIGQAVAADLLTRHGANVVLLTREALPDRAGWNEWLRLNAPQDPTVRKIAALRHLETLGGVVRHAVGDVCDPAEMARVIADIRAEFGTLNGVYHTAGTLRDGPIMAKTEADIAAVFAPKVHGTRILDQLLPDGAVDFIVLFASTSTATRPAGQVDYVAANAYLNAFATSRQGGTTRVIAVNWGVWAGVGMAAEAAAARRGDVAEAPVTPTEMPLLAQATFDADGHRLFKLTLNARKDWIVDEHRTESGAAVLPGTGFIELAAEALRAQGEDGGFTIRDLTFFRALEVAEDAEQAVHVHLARHADGYAFEVRSLCTVEGRAAYQVNAQAQLALTDLTPGAIDLAAISARCPRVERSSDAQRLMSPQEAHLAFGPRWHVLQQTAIGTGEGIARLSLPAAYHSDLADGIQLHPGLMDLATGWAMRLIPGYAGNHLWVPLSYGRVRVLRTLPADVVSHVRLRGADAAGFASFDVTITDTDGQVCVEISDFAMKRLESGFTLGTAPTARDVTFADAGALPAPGPEERRFLHTLSMGIRADEGPAALTRAMALGLPVTYVSSVDLPALVRATQPVVPSATKGQTFDRPDLDGAYLAPRNGIEETLAGFWQTLLGVGLVGVEDSFFDLGGHSLIAVRLFAMIRKTFDVQFPISVLFEAPTIAKCAAMIAERTGAALTTTAHAAATKVAYSHLVALHQGNPGRGTPLFIVAGMLGNVLNLRHLALLMGNDRPVYGLQAKGLIGDDTAHQTIEDAATAYIAEIRAVQPDGPYLLGGYSGGGITAYDMAQKLVAAGQVVQTVVMLDTPLPVRPSLTRTDKAIIKLHQFRRKGPAYIAEWMRNRLQWEKARREVHKDDDSAAPGAQFNNHGIEAAFRQAVAAYHAQPYAGPVSLFRPPLDRHWPVSGGNWVSAAREYVFDDNDWRKLAPAVQVIEVPGDHNSIVLLPNVGVLAKRLRGVISEAEPQTTAAPGWANATAAE